MGYGYAAVCLIQALQRQNIRVDFMNADARVHLNFIQPEWYQSPKIEQYKIGYTPWESSVIPEFWPEYMAAQDEIWTTSSFCQQVFANYDIESVVVPHGIDPEVFSINERMLNDKFIFFHVGEPTGRKGGQLVADAFLDLFSDMPEVQLVMKSSGPAAARWYKGDTYMGNVANHPQITVIDFNIDVEDMARLYHNTHCFVYPSNGEGFGLIPFQAIATGMPTILPNATGMADFSHWGLELKWKWTEGDGIHLGEWAQPDYADLKRLMMQVYDNWKDESKRAVQNARILHSVQTWDHVANHVANLLGDKIER